MKEEDDFTIKNYYHERIEKNEYGVKKSHSK